MLTRNKIHIFRYSNCFFLIGIAFIYMVFSLQYDRGGFGGGLTKCRSTTFWPSGLHLQSTKLAQSTKNSDQIYNNTPKTVKSTSTFGVFGQQSKTKIWSKSTINIKDPPHLVLACVDRYIIRRWHIHIPIRMWEGLQHILKYTQYY